VELTALPLWVYINLKKRIGQQRAFEIMRVAILTGGIVQWNIAYEANAAFNSYLPDSIVFNRGGPNRRIADGKSECNFIWESRVGGSV
jgi:hypothetical protein